MRKSRRPHAVEAEHHVLRRNRSGRKPLLRLPTRLWAQRELGGYVIDEPPGLAEVTFHFERRNVRLREGEPHQSAVTGAWTEERRPLGDERVHIPVRSESHHAHAQRPFRGRGCRLNGNRCRGGRRRKRWRGRAAGASSASNEQGRGSKRQSRRHAMFGKQPLSISQVLSNTGRDRLETWFFRYVCVSRPQQHLQAYSTYHAQSDDR